MKTYEQFLSESLISGTKLDVGDVISKNDVKSVWQTGKDYSYSMKVLANKYKNRGVVTYVAKLTNGDKFYMTFLSEKDNVDRLIVKAFDDDMQPTAVYPAWKGEDYSGDPERDRLEYQKNIETVRSTGDEINKFLDDFDIIEISVELVNKSFAEMYDLNGCIYSRPFKLGVDYRFNEIKNIWPTTSELNDELYNLYDKYEKGYKLPALVANDKNDNVYYFVYDSLARFINVRAFDRNMKPIVINKSYGDVDLFSDVEEMEEQRNSEGTTLDCKEGEDDFLDLIEMLHLENETFRVEILQMSFCRKYKLL